MMYEHQQVVISDNKGKPMRLEDSDHDSSPKLEIVDLSGMSLGSLPNPPLNLATICKLDLSNNNLQVCYLSTFN